MRSATNPHAPESQPRSRPAQSPGPGARTARRLGLLPRKPIEDRADFAVLCKRRGVAGEEGLRDSRTPSPKCPGGERGKRTRRQRNGAPGVLGQRRREAGWGAPSRGDAHGPSTPPHSPAKRSIACARTRPAPQNDTHRRALAQPRGSPERPACPVPPRLLLPRLAPAPSHFSRPRSAPAPPPSGAPRWRPPRFALRAGPASRGARRGRCTAQLPLRRRLLFLPLLRLFPGGGCDGRGACAGNDAGGSLAPKRLQVTPPSLFFKGLLAEESAASLHESRTRRHLTAE